VFADDSTALTVVAMVLLGLGLILAVSLTFLAVGRSEDAERAAERGSAPPPAGPPPPAPPTPRGAGPGRTKLKPRRRPPRRRDHGS
jgi:hypothetical protein